MIDDRKRVPRVSNVCEILSNIMDKLYVLCISEKMDACASML
jgi:hypothetical protein